MVSAASKDKEISTLKTGMVVGIIIILVLIGFAINSWSTISSLKSQINPSQHSINENQTTIISNNYQTKYDQLISSLQNPDIINLASNKTITVPGYLNNTLFYNSTYGVYNNYTVNGAYNISFKAPYDGYLILYVQSTDAPVLTYGISANSNSSGTIECYGGCQQYNFTTGAELKGISGFTDTPAVNSTFYHFIPVLRGTENFSFQNSNQYPIQITYSLTYVGDNRSDMTPLTINYSK